MTDNCYLFDLKSEFLNKQPFPFFASQYIYLQQFLTKLGENSPFSVCIKDIETKKVCLSNVACQKFWGLSEKEIFGVTARDVLMRVSGFINAESELLNIERHEYLATQQRKHNTYQQVLLSYDGFVQVRQSHIIPISGLFNRLIATAGLALDLTRYTDLSQLLNLYSYYYPKRAEAVAKYADYLHIATYFYILPSYEELRLLLVMMTDCRHRYIGTRLGISPKTVANYLSSIRNKLKPDYDVYSIVNRLRTPPQYLNEFFSTVAKSL